MTFNSVSFLIFFPIVVTLYFLFPHRVRWFHLLISSAIFYMFFIPKYLLILVFTILIDYVAGLLLDSQKIKRRKAVLIMSLVANLGILSFFKYGNFILSNGNSLIRYFGGSGSWPLLDIILPIGLSFHTFQAMSYTIEVYRGKQKAEHHLGIFALYVLFFPQLVAGPIERPQNILHQFREKHGFRIEELVFGLRLILWGMFKKVVVADRMELLVNTHFADPQGTNGVWLFVGSLAFSVQIYCDFSGYSDIALGSARVMGFRLMQNFSRPYFSSSLPEFWRRWHISLSGWFRDYVYVPLGGNRRGAVIRYGSLFIVFVLSGLWHGAAWNFVAWGCFHGIGMVAYVATRGIRKSILDRSGLSAYSGSIRVGSILVTFLFVTLAWILFRNGISQAGIIYAKIFSETQFPADLLPWLASLKGILAWGGAFLVMGADWLEERRERGTLPIHYPSPVRWVAYAAATLAILNLGVADKVPFIYFQF